MLILLTGCNGKLGRSVADRSAGTGIQLVGTDISPAPGRPHPLVVGDLRDPATIHRAFERCPETPAAVIHLANHTNSMVAPADVVLRENLAMNSTVFMAAAQYGVRRIAFASSIQAMLPSMEHDGSFGKRVPHALPLNESIEPMPSNVYGISKLITERLLSSLCDARAIKTPAPLSAVSVRLPYILGREQFDVAARRTAPADFMWGGSEAFAYIHVDDAADSMLAAATASGILGHEVVWCTAPDPRSAETVASLVERFYKDVPGAVDAAMTHSLTDCSKAMRLLGWKASRVLSHERRRLGVSPAGETGSAPPGGTSL